MGSSNAPTVVQPDPATSVVAASVVAKVTRDDARVRQLAGTVSDQLWND